MALVQHSSPKGTYGQTSEIIQFLKDGERAIRISHEKDIILVLGVTGSGKSTLTQFVTGNDEHLEAVEAGEDTGEYVIRDKGNKVCSTTTESCTTVPDLIIDRKTQTPLYDCPGFVDTRHVKHDLSVTYFIKKVIQSANSVKLIFTVSYPSVRHGVDRQNFMLLVKSAVDMIKDIDKFQDSIALIVTKVDNQYTVRKGKAIRVMDENIINNIASFLEEVKHNLMAKLSQTPLPDSEYTYLGKAIKFIDVLLTRSGKEYPRIGIFRRPDDAGKLETPLMLDNRKGLEKILHQNLDFTDCRTEDFGYSVSAESINRIHEMIEQVNQKIASDVESLAEEIEEGFLLQERDVSDLDSLYKKFHFGYEAMQNLTSIKEAGDPRDFLMKIRETAGFLNIDLSKERVDSIVHFDRFLKFIHTLSGVPTAKPLEWVEGLTNVVKSFDDSQKWYYFLLNLQKTLQKHEVQKNVSKNSTALDGLRDQIRVFEDDASPVKEALKQFLAEVFEDDSEKEYNSIKSAKLNSWKLKFLNNMLDFQVLTLCQDNKLVVIGYYVHLSDVARKKCNDVKFIEIFALSKIFIDTSFYKTGSKIQLSILAPMWDVIGSPKIVLDGERGMDYMTKAPDGARSSADGNDGLPGSPGGAAGNFLGFARNCNNCQFLTISTDGGRGGKGQDGGNGIDGVDCKRPPKANHHKNIFNIGLVRVSHEDKGSQGQKGGDGGRGGEGGKGGNKGKILLFMFDTPKASLPKTSQVDGSLGIPGNGGIGGSGGENEHLVESNTYILGLNAWSNGLVSHFFFPSPDGSTTEEHNDEGMKYPEPSVDLENPSFPVNHYKAYVRENLDRSLSRLSLEGFMEQLETSEDVRSLYDTLGLVNDLQCLENRYHKLYRRVPLLPFYKSLQNKIEAYAIDPPYSEISGQYRKVRAFLYLSTLSKICTIDNNLSNNLVINVKDFLGMMVKDVDELLKNFMVAKQRNQQRNAFQKIMSSNINEANVLIKEDITMEIQTILAEVDETIRALVSETQRLKDITRKEQEKLNEYMITWGISKVLKIASRALDFFGGAGLAVEGIIESTNLISDTLAVEDANSPSSEKLGALPKIVGSFFSSISKHIEEKINLFITQLFDVENILMVFEGRGIPVLNDTRSVIIEVRGDLPGMPVYPEEDFEKVDNKRNELIGFLQDRRKDVETVLKGDPILEKALDAIDRSEQILKLPEGIYSLLKKSEAEEFRSGQLDANEKLKQLEAYEEKIYSILAPLCKKLKEQFDDFRSFGSFGGKSHAALDVGKWKVQNVLSDINSQIMAMTEGFQVHGALTGTLEKLKFGISTMIQVYDRIQDYHDQAALADYMAEIASNKAKVIEVTDTKLSDAIDDLQVILKTNLILADYEMAMNAFGQHVFPFAKAYMEEFDLPASLKAENSTGDLLSEAIYRINSIERKLIKNDLTIDKSLDDHFFPDIAFSSRSQYEPFYEWKYETTSRDISQLLQGNEVTLHADITKGLRYNAVKFNEIGIRFLLGNSASQIIFDEIMGKFSVEMTHFGMSYYRCGTKFYVMTHDTHKITHSVNEDDVGGFYHYNGVYEKISRNKPLLSPYTMWKVKLHNISTGFEALANFTNEIIDLTLEGRGTFVGRDVDRYVCSDHLDSYYKIDDTIDEVPNIDYIIDRNPVGGGPQVGVARRRRSTENALDEADNDFAKKDSGFEVFSPLKRFIRWLSGGERNAPDHNQVGGFFPQRDYDGLDEAYEPIIGPPFSNTEEPQFSGNLGVDSSHSPLNQVNYDLVASQSNLLLLDLIMRLKTGTKHFGTSNLEVMDDEYAQNMAYHAYAPKNDEDTVIVD